MLELIGTTEAEVQFGFEGEFRREAVDHDAPFAPAASAAVLWG